MEWFRGVYGYKDDDVESKWNADDIILWRRFRAINVVEVA